MGLICFDLDGTLVDPLRAMEHCVGTTCQDLGLKAPSREDIASCIGFGPAELFASLPGLEDPALLDRALAAYWSSFEAIGISKHRVYEGIPLLLTRLKRQGHSLFLVTVQPTRYARRILHEFDLLLAFEEVFGTAPGDRFESKGKVLAQLRAQGVVQPGGYMVGDRADDMASGRTNGLIPVGVTYGYGTAAELREAGAGQLIASPEALDAWFRAQFPGSEIHDAFSLSE